MNESETSGRGARWLATAFGAGYCPVAPGTAGSLAGLVVAYGAWSLAGHWALVVLLAVALPVAIWSAGQLVASEGEDDPSIVVIDEVVGQWTALLGALPWSWKAGVAAFVLFRIFDVLKPPPARQSEGFPGGWGVVADDLVAGVYAGAALWLARHFQWI